MQLAFPFMRCHIKVEFLFTIETASLSATSFLRPHWRRFLTQRETEPNTLIYKSFMIDNGFSQPSVKSTGDLCPQSMTMNQPHLTPLAPTWDFPKQLTAVLLYDSNDVTRLLERWRKREKGKLFNLKHIPSLSYDLEMSSVYYQFLSEAF